MLIAEEFLLLCLDDVTGRKSATDANVDTVLAGALLVELALMERIGITSDDEGLIKRRRITIISTKPTDDDVLDDAVSYIDAKEATKVQDLISPMSWKPMSKGLRQRLLQRLADSGALSERRGKVLGIFPTTSWPTADAAPEAEVRARLRSALVDGLTPTERTVALISLLYAAGQLNRTLPGEDKKLVKRRAKALAEGDWAARAVMAVIASVDSGSTAAFMAV